MQPSFPFCKPIRNPVKTKAGFLLNYKTSATKRVKKTRRESASNTILGAGILALVPQIARPAAHLLTVKPHMTWLWR